MHLLKGYLANLLKRSARPFLTHLKCPRETPVILCAATKAASFSVANAQESLEQSTCPVDAVDAIRAALFITCGNIYDSYDWCPT